MAARKLPCNGWSNLERTPVNRMRSWLKLKRTALVLATAGVTSIGLGGCGMDGLGMLLLSRVLNGGSGSLGDGLTSGMDSLLMQVLDAGT